MAGTQRGVSRESDATVKPSRGSDPSLNGVRPPSAELHQRDPGEQHGDAGQPRRRHRTLGEPQQPLPVDPQRGQLYETGAYAAWHQHVTVLLGELRPDDDSALLAHLVLAPLAPDLVRHPTREVGASGERVRGEVRALAARVTA
jgi:hypothetical protein